MRLKPKDYQMNMELSKMRKKQNTKQNRMRLNKRKIMIKKNWKS